MIDLKTLTMLGGALALAACASTATTPDDPLVDGQMNEATPEVPAYDPIAERGYADGSKEDFEENAGHRVFFGYNQYNLTNEAQSVLARQAAWLEEYPETRLRLVGSADERGTREYNLALGARRANAAKDYLVGLGVDASRVSTMSVGKERPVDTGSTPDAWAKNRNATTVLTSVVGS